MKNKDKFDISRFISPDILHSPVYVWVWNDVCTREIIDNQLIEMQNLGIRAFYILPEPKNFRPDSMPTGLTPEYLSDEFFDLCAYAVQKATGLGMICWIYDEGGWPSGGACGKVLKEHPEYAREVLKTIGHSFSAGDIYKKSSPDVLAAFLNDKEMAEEGYEFISDVVVTEYTTEKTVNGDTDYPDLLNQAATEYFIEITHEKYASALKDASGKIVTAIFTDEPKAPSSAFNKELAEKYELTYGESILPYLPLIAGKTAPTEENVHILHRWYDLCSRMFCDNFLLPCKKWANDHGMAFTGHMDKDHDPLGCMQGGGNFNLMRALRCFDIPGIDIIWRQLYPEDKITERNDMNGYNGFFPRYASSAAAQNGSKFALSEIFGVGGCAMTYDTMRYTVGYQAVRGINIFNPFNFPLGRKGQLLAQELPVFTKNQPYCRFLGQFNTYVERLSYLSTLGERVCDTGLYYPVSDFQGGLKADIMAKAFDTLGRALEDMTVDFDIVDDDVIQASDGAENGCICIGNANYRNIIIPEGAFIPPQTQTVLDRFIKGGGKVLHSLTGIRPAVNVEGKGLRTMLRKAENAELFFLFRECGDNRDYCIHLPSSDGYLLHLETGKLQRFKAENGHLNLSLALGETTVIMLTDETLGAENKKEFSFKTDISDGFLFRKEAELSCGENGFENIRHSDNSVSVILGDWAAIIGSDYSGSGVYEAEFTLPTENMGKEGEIDLGEVHYAAEVYLNGHFLGAALMPPYRFRIPDGVLTENNKLKTVVTNTSANWYFHTNYFDKWNIKELSPYFEAEIEYAKDLVSGGLYGPVTLYTE
ncbi:MAG: hypothetical protein IKB88_05585 [Clostridia bacterium]|nr:hypothetical protein [Clostridia bacterium]